MDWLWIAVWICVGVVTLVAGLHFMFGSPSGRSKKESGDDADFLGDLCECITDFGSAWFDGDNDIDIDIDFD